MTRLTPDEIDALADAHEATAARHDRAANSARHALTNPNLPDDQRAAATAYIPTAEADAHHHREQAARLREGVLPGSDQ